MLQDFITSLLYKAEYTKDENGIILAKIPGYQGYFSQGDNIEEARENLIDAIQGVIIFKLLKGDEETKRQIEDFLQNNSKEYA